MDPKFIVDLKGQKAVLYAGLLAEAHEQGLTAISTSLVQIPSEDNGHVAICMAAVTVAKGTFTGIGDASPQNVGRMIIPHIIRMAETRAKARAMRDAVNIGMVSKDELGGDDEDERQQSRPQPRQQQTAPQRAPAPQQRPAQAAPPQPATPAQPAPAKTADAVPIFVIDVSASTGDDGCACQAFDVASGARCDKSLIDYVANGKTWSPEQQLQLARDGYGLPDGVVLCRQHLAAAKALRATGQALPNILRGVA